MGNVDQTADDRWVDADGYPTEAALDRLRHWPADDAAACLAFLQTIWWAADWGCSQRGTRYYFSTGGWSGNEDCIRALRQNDLLWAAIYYVQRRGGHYVFWLE